jgi:hypothetical protein
MTATGLPDSTVKGVPMAGPINSGELVAVFLTGARIEHRLTLMPLDSLGVPAHWHHVGSQLWNDQVQRPEGCTTRHYARFITGFGDEPAYVPRPERVTGWRLVTDWVPVAPAEHASTESLPAGRLPEGTRMASVFKDELERWKANHPDDADPATAKPTPEPEPEPEAPTERPPMVWGIAGKHGWHGASEATRG